MISIWEVYDSELQHVPEEIIRSLQKSLNTGNVSSAWESWTRAAETEPCNACCQAGGPLSPTGTLLKNKKAYVENSGSQTWRP